MAVNMAVGVHHAAGVHIPVHRNLVFLKSKATTMASYASNNLNPAPKNSALQLQVPTTRRTTLAITRGIRMSVAAADVVPPKLPPALHPATIINFKNSLGAGLNFHLKDKHIWKGDEEPSVPEVIERTAEFKHNGDAEDGQSIGGLVYLFQLTTTLIYWVVSWKNVPESDENKVYTKIISANNPIHFDHPFWAEIYGNLILQQHNDEDRQLAYLAQLKITSTDKPLTLAATFKNT